MRQTKADLTKTEKAAREEGDCVTEACQHDIGEYEDHEPCGVMAQRTCCDCGQPVCDQHGIAIDGCDNESPCASADQAFCTRCRECHEALGYL